MHPSSMPGKAFQACRICALTLTAISAAVLLLLLLALVPMLLFGGNVQIDSGGFLDLLLQSTRHDSAVISAKLVFLGALPLLLAAALFLALLLVIDFFLRRVKKRRAWFFAEGLRFCYAAAVAAGLCAAVPSLVSAAVKAAVDASGTFAVKPWNPAGGIVLFVFVCAGAILYKTKTTHFLAQAAAGAQETQT